MKLTEYERQTMTNATVVVLLDVRRMALRAGANPLRLWDQLLSRMRAAARTTASAAEWATKILRDLQIGSPNKDLSSSIADLETATHGHGAAWLALLEREHGYVIALARLEAERRRDVRELEQLGGEGAVPDDDREQRAARSRAEADRACSTTKPTED